MTSLKTILLTLPLAFAVPLVAAADDDAFTTHFMTEWDLDADGKITLEEVTERRGSVFLSFDANEDGTLDGEEQALMAEMRDTQHAEMGGQGMGNGQGMMGQGHGQGKGHGAGMGQGKGMGQGQGMGQGKGMMGQGGMGRAQMAAEAGMHQGQMFDTDNDGKWSRDEFVGFSETWLARMDTDGDSVITKADF